MVQGVSSPRKRGAGVARKPLDSRVRGNGGKPKAQTRKQKNKKKEKN